MGLPANDNSLNNCISLPITFWNVSKMKVHRFFKKGISAQGPNTGEETPPVKFWMLEGWRTTVTDSEDPRKLNLKPSVEKAETTWLLSRKQQRAQKGAACTRLPWKFCSEGEAHDRKLPESCQKTCPIPRSPPTSCATRRLPLSILAERGSMLWESKPNTSGMKSLRRSGEWGILYHNQGAC